MTRLEDRQILARDIEQACADGARLARIVLWPASTPACCSWKAGDGLIQRAARETEFTCRFDLC